MSRFPVRPSRLKPLGRRGYALWGFVLLALKYNLDRLIVYNGYGRPWYPWDYLAPGRALGEAAMDSTATLPLPLGFVLLLESVPFILAGLWLTLRRLRSAGWPGALVALFFVPFINLVFFALLCVMPADDGETSSGRWSESLIRRLTPQSTIGAAALAIAATTAMGVPLVILATVVLQDYGWGLFIGVPFMLGLVGTLLDAATAPRSLGRATAISALSVALVGVLIIAIAVEGVICVVMASPLALGLSMFGGLVGWLIQRERWRFRAGEAARVYGFAFVVLPLLLVAENRISTAPIVTAATTSIRVAASPDVVWRLVVTFSELPPPREPWFLAGIAYPVRSRLDGHGIGAVRYCEFSTGAFIEPITAWEEPSRLAFDVLDQPPPLREWTPYAAINPAHLDGFFRSRRGEFRLTPIDGGRATLLEGTTWYEHRLWPTLYWRPWSNFLIHSIHRRVLSHIAYQAEGLGSGQE